LLSGKLTPLKRDRTLTLLSSQTDSQSADAARSTWCLAVECSGTGGSVCLSQRSAENAKPEGLDATPEDVQQIIFPDNGGSVRHLAPAISTLLAEANLASPDFLAVSVGPGSFTGLRVGLATIKLLAFAWQREIAPIDTLHAIAHSAAVRLAGSSQPHSATIVPVINAFRKQVFTSAWHFVAVADGWSLKPLCAPIVCDAVQWQSDPLISVNGSSPPAADDPIVVAGPGLKTYRPADDAVQQLARNPLAEDVAQVGWQHLQRGQLVSPDSLAPNYIRPSAAEEKQRS